MKVFALIPARGGSKGVVRKNVRLLGERPLIAHTIAAAQQSQTITRFLTSTDDDEIAAVAQAYGSPVLRRPPELAADDTPMIPVILHALDFWGESPDYFVLLQPTTPQRTAADIDAAVRLLHETGADSVISVYQVEDHHPTRMYLLENGRLHPYATEPTSRLRQALTAVYHRNGAIYACRPQLLRDHNTLIGPDTRPYLMPRARSLNIDDEMDFAFAEFLWRTR
ncbi:MAG: acylneuraminate cytidylyltransferase family protein [Anaerolineales bacterium]|nr:acylneuraminate cytidylyltransferase family protein [Anaerolineales bacterium]